MSKFIELYSDNKSAFSTIILLNIEHITTITVVRADETSDVTTLEVNEYGINVKYSLDRKDTRKLLDAIGFARVI